jgi:hypothetical protein
MSSNMLIFDSIMWVPLPQVPLTRRLSTLQDLPKAYPLYRERSTEFVIRISPYLYGYGEDSEFNIKRKMTLVYPGVLQSSLVNLLQSLPLEKYVSLLTLSIILLSLPSSENLSKILSLIKLSKKETKIIIHLLCSFPDSTRVQTVLENLSELPDYLMPFDEDEDSGETVTMYPTFFRKAIDSVLWSLARGKSSWLELETPNPEKVRDILGFSTLNLTCPKTKTLFPNPHRELRELEITESFISLKMNLRDSGLLMMSDEKTFYWETRTDEYLSDKSKAFLEYVHPRVLYRIFSFLESIKILMMTDVFQQIVDRTDDSSFLVRSTLPYQDPHYSTEEWNENNGFDFSTGTVYKKSDYGDLIHAELAWKLANLIEKTGLMEPMESYVISELLWLSPETEKMILIFGVLMDLGKSFVSPSYYHQMSTHFEETIFGRPLIIKSQLKSEFPQALEKILENSAQIETELVGKFLSNPLISSHASKAMEAYLFDVEP